MVKEIDPQLKKGMMLLEKNHPDLFKRMKYQDIFFLFAVGFRWGQQVIVEKNEDEEEDSILCQ